METYLLNNFIVYEEFNNKIINGYVIREIICYLDKLVEEKDLDNFYKFQYDHYNFINYFPNLEYYNNQIIFKTYHFHDKMKPKWQINNDTILDFHYDKWSYGDIYFPSSYNINKFEIKIIKPEYIIEITKNNCEYHQIIIRSNHFNNIESLFSYFYEITNMTNDEILNYFTQNDSCDLSFNKLNDNNNNEIILYQKQLHYDE